MNNYHLKSRHIGRIARNIFGDIVDSAYIESYDKEILQFAARKYRDRCKNLNSNSLSTDGDAIILKFNNGNLVRFSNSEWATISKCEKLNTYES